MTPDQVAAIHQVLVDECGAAHDDLEAFAQQWPECREYRFGGTLGFGGKVWAGTWTEPPYVTQYPEHATEGSKAAIERANVRLARIAFTSPPPLTIGSLPARLLHEVWSGHPIVHAPEAEASERVAIARTLVGHLMNRAGLGFKIITDHPIDQTFTAQVLRPFVPPGVVLRPASSPVSPSPFDPPPPLIVDIVAHQDELSGHCDVLLVLDGEQVNAQRLISYIRSTSHLVVLGTSRSVEAVLDVTSELRPIEDMPLDVAVAGFPTGGDESP